MSGLDLHRELRAVAESIIEGRKAFEEHVGRRSTKPLQPVALDLHDALELLDDLAAAEAAVARVEALADEWTATPFRRTHYNAARALRAALKGGDDE